MINWNQVRSLELVSQPNNAHIIKCFFLDDSCVLLRLKLDANHHFFREFEIAKKIQEVLWNTPWTKWQEPLVEIHNIDTLPRTIINNIKYLVDNELYKNTYNHWIQVLPFFNGFHFEPRQHTSILRSVTAMGLLHLFTLQTMIPGFRHNDAHFRNWLWTKESHLFPFKIDLDHSSEQTICLNTEQDPQNQVNVYFIDFEFSSSNEHNFGNVDKLMASKFTLAGISSTANNAYDPHFFLVTLYNRIRKNVTYLLPHEKEFCDFVERHICSSLLVSVNASDILKGFPYTNHGECTELYLENLPTNQITKQIDGSALLLNNRLNRLTLTAAKEKETMGSFFSRMEQIFEGVDITEPPVSKLMNWVHYDYLPDTEKVSTLTTMLRDPYICSFGKPCPERPLYVINSK